MKKYQFLFTLLLLPLMVFADAVEIDGIYYNLFPKGNFAEVTSNPNYYSGSVVIPASIEYDEITYSVTSIGVNAFYQCSNLTSVTIPCSVTSIGRSAFAECSSLTTIDIPNSLKSIGEQAFNGCVSLTSVNIPDGLTTIGVWAFKGCASLTSINIPNSLTQMGTQVFENCTGLTLVTIADGVASIPAGTFWNCSSLTFINIPNSVNKIGNNAFYHCRSLTSITIPNNLERIEGSTFSGCNSLRLVVIPNSVNAISQYAFEECSSLTSVIIGSGVRTLSLRVFAACPELSDVYCYAANVPKGGDNAFEDSYIEYATLHVPEECINEYKVTTPWNGFKNIVASGPVAIYSLIYMVDGKVYKSYDIVGGSIISLEQAPTKEGYTFSGWSDIPTTMPAEDVTVTGTFTINRYKVSYMVDGKLYQEKEVEYGAEIVTPTPPAKEGYDFSWMDVPEKMPAYDITINGSYATGIDAVIGNGKPFDVYSTTGVLLRRQVTTLKGLPAGFYIVNGKKVYVKYTAEPTRCVFKQQPIVT